MNTQMRSCIKTEQIKLWQSNLVTNWLIKECFMDRVGMNSLIIFQKQ
jgi:hypothetical protein